MASSLTVRVANVTSTVTFAKTDQAVGQVIRWFLADKADPPPQGATQAELNQWWLDQASAEIVRYVRREAQRNRLQELRDEQQSIEQRATDDTSI